MDPYTKDVLEYCKVFDEEFEAFKQVHCMWQRIFSNVQNFDVAAYIFKSSECAAADIFKSSHYVAADILNSLYYVAADILKFYPLLYIMCRLENICCRIF